MEELIKKICKWLQKIVYRLWNSFILKEANQGNKKYKESLKREMEIVTFTNHGNIIKHWLGVVTELKGNDKVEMVLIK